MPAPMDTNRRKSLSIHIATDHVGPHGTPLVYGSTPEKVGTIKGTVRFSCNYDCKGKDIIIIYEAVAEGHWEALENKKIVRHQTREILGHQVWQFPLVHTRPGGSTVAAGEYAKDFEVLLVRPSETTAKLSPYHSTEAKANRSSLHSADFSPLILPSLILPPTHREGMVPPMMPSTSHSPQANIKYTVRAILQRPFPSITNVEASQEIWVLHSSLPPPPLLLPPSHLPDVITPSQPADTTQQETSPDQAIETTAEPTKDPSTPGTLLSIPSRAIKSALSAFLPSKRSSPSSNEDIDSKDKAQKKEQDVVVSSPTSGDSVDNEIQYTGVWEPFDVPYCFSLPSETVCLGQRLPLTIQFGPCGQEHVRPSGNNNKRGTDPRSRFVVKKGILKLMEHTLLREVTVMPAPARLIGARTTQVEDPMSSLGPRSRIKDSSNAREKSIYNQNGVVTGSQPHLHALFRRNQQQSSQHGRSFSAAPGPDTSISKRHSLDHSPSAQATSVTGNTARIISSVENKFKTEVMTISLSPLFQIQERDRRRRIWERQQESSSDSESGQESKSGRGRFGETDGGEESDGDDDTWRSTVWIQMPGPSEMATGTETKGIVKTHTIQLILLCGMISPQGGSVPVEVPALANAPSSASTVSLSPSGNREFRLESVMVISMNGKIRAYVSRGLEVLSDGTTVTDTAEDTKQDAKGKGAAQKNTPTTASSSGSIPPSQHGVLTIKAQGRAISKAVTVAEILKRRLEGSLHQFTEIGQITEQEIWDPNEDKPNLDPLIVSRHRPTIRIRLSKQLPPITSSSAREAEHSDFENDSVSDGEESEGEAWPGAVLDRDAAARRFVGYQEPTGNDIYL
ncbi:hypothetical protein BGZ52_002041 [Haplosporangium bisporale]|nr:hypothetical protein BGZ52_002041 [Haplosporangium bisporale]